MYRKGARVGASNETYFTIENVLSDHGGMAMVCEASVVDKNYPERNGARVALKIARNNESNAHIFEQLLIRETELLDDLRHPGIVRILPITQFGKRRYFARAKELDPSAPWYFVMEMLGGGTLVRQLDNRRLTLEWKVELLYQIAIIMDYLHLREVAHRDLKPDNIMFRTPIHAKQTPTPVLIDFGLAEKRSLAPDVTAATVSHAAPERVEHLVRPGGRPRTTDIQPDHLPADIWALGVVAYEVLNWGRHPFGNSDQRTVLAQAIMQQAPQPMGREIPAALARLVEAMLAKNRDHRPKINEVIRALESEVEIASPRI